MYSNKAVLFSFGVGGHNAQANRLASILLDDLSDFDIVTISDLKKKPEWSQRHYICGELREKESHLQMLTNLGPFKILKTIFKIKKENNIKCVVSTGPGISILTSVFFKIFGVKIIHIETWSRFTTKSMTGRFMYYLSDKFYIQNKSLKDIYPNAIYAGML
ncbi:PssD/Cps14F family polysaccharide biosynthesis glycosyltransferase [Photobacterium leiognathi]|uniref:PssD/Cps14F family polysaccharide biosynthesis glycosyltransferase n=1 Tax=Photobacterium leiognathi TaxID=553611 RepID=UPI00020884D7|nr:PssD/Cps14F family polysaccharide biosynthesis glycosyltransferase [Photobacterium leiognathi]PSW53766.1 polysaccharide biosynthesis protein [Photobacterium leiognathi subsp. mandapamensis]GAA04677.1 oligosaccharide biosynthesis Alg14 like family protein [Photobacterium leiognathi subsp. mandapamensis svers.1.1.]